MTDTTAGTLGLQTVLVNAAAWDGPGDLPDDAVIVNAPRPLLGDRTWQARFRHGVFYAAMPARPAEGDGETRHHADVLRSWRADDAWQVVFTTNEQIEAQVMAKFAEYGYASAEDAGVTVAEQAAAMQLPWHDEPTGEELLVAQRGADRAEAALLGTAGLTWRRLASGNWGAFGTGRFYLAGKLDQKWFLESWAADRDAPGSDPRSADEQFGLRRLADAQAEAQEREEFAGLLHGKYGMPVAAAHEVMATTRKHGWDEVAIDKREPACSVLIEGWRLRTGHDAGGYTIEELEHEYGSACPAPVPSFIDSEDIIR